MDAGAVAKTSMTVPVVISSPRAAMSKRVLYLLSFTRVTALAFAAGTTVGARVAPTEAECVAYDNSGGVAVIGRRLIVLEGESCWTSEWSRAPHESLPAGTMESSWRMGKSGELVLPDGNSREHFPSAASSLRLERVGER